MSYLRYSDRSNWKDIEKQMIFEAWVPYVSDRPLDFFIPFKTDDKNPPSALHKRSEGFITDIIEDNSNFSAHLVVTPLKRRKVVILSRDEVCQSYDDDEVLIAKIVSVKKWMRSLPWYSDLVNGSHQWFVHLPESETGVESYINMSQIMTIGKKMLISQHSLLDPERMKMVESRYMYSVALGLIKGESEEDEDESAVNE